MGLSVKGDPKRALMRRTNRSHVGRLTAVELHAVEPQLDIVEEVEHSDPHPMVVRCVAHLEEAFAAIDPRQWVTGAVELWKLELVEGLDVITGLVVVGVVTLRPTAVGGVVGVVDPVVQLCSRGRRARPLRTGCPVGRPVQRSQSRVSPPSLGVGTGSARCCPGDCPSASPCR
jgi:hypothetical protein